jgi:hypothetical protein
MGLLDRFRKQKEEQPTVVTTNEREDGRFAFDVVYDTLRKEMQPLLSLGEVIYWGVDNRLPFRLNAFYKNVPIHSRIINYKRDFLSRNYIFDLEGLSISEKINFELFRNHITSEGDFDNFDDFISKLAIEFLSSGNLFIKVSKNDEGVIKKVNILQSERVRVIGNPRTYEIKSYAYSPDWWNRSDYIEIPKFELGKKSDTHSILCFQNKLPDYKMYGEPDWISAYHCLEVQANIPYFHSQNMLNGVNLSGLLTFFNAPKDPEMFKDFMRRINNVLRGTKNSGGVMISMAENKEQAPEFTNISPSNLDKSFLQLGEDMEKAICQAHGIAPAITGIPTPGKLGATQEIEFLSGKFEENLERDKRMISDIINKLLKLTGNTKVRFYYKKEEKKEVDKKDDK